jgi:hypothetical protein
MKFFCIKNLVTHSVFHTPPWEFKTNIPDYTKEDKKARSRWWNTPKTEHLFYNMIEGENENVRVSKTNPPVRMYGFVADYDSVISPEQYEQPNFKDTHVLPTAWSLTSSGRGRMVWAFEQALPLPDMQTTTEFLKVAAKELNLKNIWGGFDEAFYRSSQYYEVGHSWKVIDTNLVPHTIVCGLMAKAWERRNRNVTCAIELDEIYPEIERCYPGAWEGAFELGARTRRFWDTSATNPTSAILRANGFQCFSGPQAFVYWEDILDKSFIDKAVASKMKGITDGVFFDGRNYYRKNDANDWLIYNKDDIKLFLRVRLGLSAKASSQSAVSDLDRTLCFIQETNRIDGAFPYVNHKQGIIIVNGQKILNTCKCKALQPVSNEFEAEPKDFSWLANFFKNLFDSEDQLPYFLAWLKRFYEDSLYYKARSGQAIFLVGPPDMGKTLLADFIIAKMVGGFRDASSFMLGTDSGFTAPYMEVPLLTVNDEHAVADERSHTRYSSVVKKLVANKEFLYNQKFEKAGNVKWCGRVVITLNEDPRSLRLLPDLEISMLDKVMLFKLSEIRKDFFDGFTKRIEHELPYFCNWLLRWRAPESVLGGVRFGVKSYLHKDLHLAATQSGAGNAFYEILTMFLRNTSEDYTATWEGTTAQLLSEMVKEESTRPLVQGMTVRFLGTMMGQLKSQGYPVENKHTRYGTQWAMPYELSRWYSAHPNDEDDEFTAEDTRHTASRLQDA